MCAQPHLAAETPAVGKASLEFRLLGPLEVRRSGEVVAFGGHGPRSLLALLLLYRGTVVSVDRIVDELWGEAAPRTARHMVEVYVSKVRKVLGRDVVVTRPPGYLLAVATEEVDADRFERLLAEAQDALGDRDAALVATRLGDALALWRGQALADFVYEPFAQAEITRLEDLRFLAEEERVEAELALGRGPDLVPQLEVLVARAPLRERFRAQLMLALYRAGRQVDALAAYRVARETLVEQLGVEPGPELRNLERAILAKDESLAVPRTAESAPARQRETRRTITILVAEPGGAGIDHDPELFRSATARSRDAARETLDRYGASVEELPDGMLMSAFGSPLAHEDDPFRAVSAARDLQALGLVVRAGLDTGEVLTGGAAVTGQLVHAAAQICHGAASGEIVLSGATRRLVADAVTAEPVRSGDRGLWRVTHVSLEAPARRLLLDVPLIGRAAELAVLRDAFVHSTKEPGARLVTVLGEPGIGKSRLAYEFSDIVASSARVLVGRCVPYGEGITYWSLREVFRQIGVEDEGTLNAILADDQDRQAITNCLVAVLGEGEGQYSVEAIRWAAQRLFEALARQQPLVLVFDDVHWAEPTFLELLRHVVEAGRQAPILVVCLARSELTEERPDWEPQDERASTLALEALSSVDVEEFVSALDSYGTLPQDRRAQVVDAARGNPLFLEQLFALAMESGPGHSLDVPPTLRALLTARLDRLGPGERATVECAAVVGREFWPSAVSELMPPDGRATLGRHLDALSRRELIQPEPSALPFETAFGFRHVLIQEAAYRSLPKQRRAELHQRLAGYLERELAGVTANEDELIGHHLEQSYRYRAEIDPIDEGLRELGERAADRLEGAGRRAMVQRDAPAAVNLLDRARALQPEGPRRHGTSVWLAEALALAGELEKAYGLLGETVEESEMRGDRRTLWLAAIDRAHLGKQIAPQEWSVARVTETAEHALRVFEVTGDHVGLTRGWSLSANACFEDCRYDKAAGDLRRALEHARQAGDEPEELRVLEGLQAALYLGSAHVNVVQEHAMRLLARSDSLQRSSLAFFSRWPV